MMHKIVTWVKAHPYMAAAIVFAIGFLLIMFFAGGSNSQSTAQSAYGPDPNAVAAATALASHQIDAQTQALGISAAAGAQNAQTSAALQLGLAQVGAQSNNATLQADLAKTLGLAQIDSQNQSQSLAAQVAQSTLSSNQAIARLQASTQTTMQAQSLAAQQAINQQNVGLAQYQAYENAWAIGQGQALVGEIVANQGMVQQDIIHTLAAHLPA